MGSQKSGIGPSLFGKSRLAVLSLLYLNADDRFYLRQIVSLTHLGMGAVQREVRNLSDGGIILREREGRQVYFQANRDCPVFADLKGILIKTAGLVDILRERLAVLAQDCQVAFVYGSFAEGSETAESDVDVMLVGDVSFAAVSDALGDVQTSLRREVNPTVYPTPEFRKKLSTPFIATIMKKPKLFLIGDANELDRLAR
ncbi:MAG: nucleotidyltransferase domain-containing protein [bacterium]